jgi:hypothetical protein
MKMRQMDKYRYGTLKDKKVIEGKIPFIITKTGTNITEKLAKEIMQEYENQSYKRLYEIQKTLKSEEKIYEKEIIRKFISLEEKYYEETQKKTNLNPNQIPQEN